MEWLNEIWSQAADYINVPYLLTFLLLAYVVKKYFRKLLDKITPFKWKGVYTVLILATIVAIPYMIFGDVEWKKIVFSYALGTSLHELVFKYIEKLFIK